ncbi:YesL family protein [Rossellomorea aquimaris]|uniref:YesL family protein n=1 Tax=Rossellomorea aquimaris TaxID=189382 RepID=UPI001CFF229D|nr:YesL family protein [Rossellomorea aquimaris]
MGGWDRFNSIVFVMLKLAYMNILWIFFTILGLVGFGFFPATVSLFTVARKWLMGEEPLPIFHTFWHTYKKEFLKSNGFAIIFTVIGYVLYYDFTFVGMNSGKLTFLVPVLVLILIAYVITLLFFFPVYVHFDLSFWKTLKQTLLIALTSPLEAVQIALAGVLIYGAVNLLPGILPFFTGSVLSMIVMWISLKAFGKIEKKKGSESFPEQHEKSL